jgi:hypothetical protein
MEITDLIDALDDTIENGGRVPLTGKRTVDTNQVADILDRMRAAIPAEIRSAHEIRTRSEVIVTDAVVAAKQIRADAEKERQASLEENSVIRAAEERGKIIIAEAEEEALKIRKRGDQAAASRIQEADAYAEVSLSNLAGQMSEVRAQGVMLESAIAEIEKSIDLGTKVLQAGRARVDHSGKNGTNGTKASNETSLEPLTAEDLKVDGLMATALDSIDTDTDGTPSIDVDAMVAAAEEKLARRR